MSAYRDTFEVVTGHETETNASIIHNSAISVIEAASHARSILKPRVQNNALIEGFSGGNGRRHYDRILNLAKQGKGMLGIMSDALNVGGMVTASLPDTLTGPNGDPVYHGLFVDCFYVGPNRAERLVEGYSLGVEMAKNLRGSRIVTERTSTVTGRRLKDDVLEIDDDIPIYAIEPSPDFEATNRTTLGRFLRGASDVEAVRSVRAEANDAIVAAGLDFVTEGDFTRELYPKAHQPGRYAVYQHLG